MFELSCIASLYPAVYTHVFSRLYVKMHLDDIVSFLSRFLSGLCEIHETARKFHTLFFRFSCFLFANVEEVPHPSPSKH